MTYHEVMKVDGMPNGTMRIVEVENQKILLAKIGDEFFGVENKCPHLGGSLGEGTLKDYVVTCPRHGSKFDVRTGVVVERGKIAFLKVKVHGLKVFPVKVEGIRVFIGTN